MPQGCQDLINQRDATQAAKEVHEEYRDSYQAYVDYYESLIAADNAFLATVNQQIIENNCT